MVKLLILFSILSFGAQATTFKAVPIQEQIKEADGMFQGNYLKSKTIEIEDGRLATQMHFKINKEHGLQSDFFGMDEVIVHYPGGQMNGNTSKIEGVPEFVPGEKVMLFIKSVNNRYWGLNLGFGSFRVINYGKETILVNYIFPHHPEVGQVNFHQFEQLVKKIKGSNLKTVQTVQHPSSFDSERPQRAPASEGQNRTVASKSEQSDNVEDRPNFSIFWLIAFLGIVGGIVRMSNRKA